MQAEAVILKDVFPFLRKRFTFLRRGAYGALAALIVGSAVAATAAEGWEMVAATGAVTFDILLWVMIVLGLFECIFSGAVAISYERERKTVDLWVVAGMEHFMMVVSKAGAVVVRMASTLLALVVPAAVAVFMGGRSVLDAQAAFLAAIGLFILAASIGVTVSTFVDRSARSVPVAMLMVPACLLGTLAVAGVWSTSGVCGASFARLALKVHPFYVLSRIGDVPAPSFLASAVLALVLSLAVSLVLLFVSGMRLKAGISKGVGRKRGFNALFAADRLLERMFPRLMGLLKPPPGDVDLQPMRWRERVALANGGGAMAGMSVSDKLVICLAGAGLLAAIALMGMHDGTWPPLSPSEGGGVILVGVMVLWVFNLIYRIRFAARASQAFSQEFETRDIEYLRMTGLSGEEIVAGKVLACLRMYVPALAMTLFCSAVLLAVALTAGTLSAGSDPAGIVMGLWWAGHYLGIWLGACFSITGLALMCSLYFRRNNRAMYMTLLIYLVAPAVAWGFISMFAFPILGALTRGSEWLIGPLVVGRILLGLAVAVVTWRWVVRYGKPRGYSRQECLTQTVFAFILLPMLGGTFLGSVCAFFVAWTLMKREFATFLIGWPQEEWRTGGVGVAGERGGMSVERRPSSPGASAIGAP